MLTRPVQPADFTAIAELTNWYIANTAVHFATSPATPQQLHDSWFAVGDTYPFLVAEDDAPAATDRFLGYAKAYRWRERDAYARTAEVGIYIARHAQGRGIGRQLYQALIDDCRARAFHTLVAGIAMPNRASIRLHEACGFAHTGTFRQVGRKFDAWHDVAFYQLML